MKSEFEFSFRWIAKEKAFRFVGGFLVFVFTAPPNAWGDQAATILKSSQKAALAVKSETTARPLMKSPPDETSLRLLELTAKSNPVNRANASSFRKRNLRGLRAFQMNLSKFDFREASLQNAVIVNSNLRGCRLEGADLRGATFVSTDVNGSTFDQFTRLPFSKEEALAMGMVQMVPRK